MIIKLNKVEILEAAFVIGPAFVPVIQSDFAHGVLENVKNKKQLDDFKKDYSGFANYKTYDDTLHKIKRGASYGAGAGGMLGAGILAGKTLEPETYDDIDNDLVAGLGALSTASGVIGGAVSGGINKLFPEKNLNEKVQEKEKLYK